MCRMLDSRKFCASAAAFVLALAATGCPRRADTPSSTAPTGPAVPATEISLTNLYDAFGEPHEGTRYDFGFSTLVRYRGKTILFDAGTNADILRRNTDALGVDLADVDFAVASHSHFDHISGFDYLLKVNPDVKIYFPADPFWGAPLPFDATGPDPHAADELPKSQRYFGGDKTKFTFDSSGRFWQANVEFVSDNREIMPGVRLVATKSPYMGYFSRYPNVGIGGEADASEIKTVPLPELSLSLDGDDGQILIVGCSHSRVDVIAEAAKAWTHEPLDLVMGGYHLLPYKEDEIRTVVGRLRDELGVRRVAPAHCTGHLGFKIFHEVYGDQYLMAGLGSHIVVAP
jgi:7,8-dihydropterin-6-yl-methyl-4-(beta-D-ribofuranosyl)aminobenzene 5'-phosphate synthase